MIGNSFRLFYRLVAGLFLGGCSLVFAQSLEFSSDVSLTTVPLHSRFEYRVSISGADTTSLPKIQLPNLKGMFDIVGTSESTSFQIVNGNVSSKVTKVFVLSPIKTGELVIEPSSMAYNGQTYSTAPVTVTVTEGGTASASGAIPGGGASSGTARPVAGRQVDNVFVESVVSKKSVYVGEQLSFDFNLLTRIRLLGDVQFEAPQMDGFLLEDLPKSPDSAVVERNGQRYYVLNLVKRYVYPLTPGSITIPKGRAGVVKNFFEGQVVIESDPVTLTVNPLPSDGRPAGFSGVVGDFSVTPSFNPVNAMQNSPLTLSVLLEGNGNIRSISELSFDESDAFRIYKSNVTDLPSQNGRDRRLFDYIVIPQQAGKRRVPSFRLTYFSPTKHAYQSYVSPPYDVQVTASDLKTDTSVPSDVEVLSRDIRYLKTGFSLHNKRYVFHSVWTWLWVCLMGISMAVSVGLLGYRRFFGGLKKTVSKDRLIKESVVAIQRMKAPLSPDDLSKMHQRLLMVVGAIVRADVTGRSMDDIRAGLLNLYVSSSIVDRLISLLESLRFSVYAPTASSSQDRDRLRADVLAILDALKGVSA